MKVQIIEIPHQRDLEYVVWERFEARVRGIGWVRHGKYWEFDRAGRLVTEGVYQNGVREGWWKDFHPNGSLEGEGLYENDRMVGIWRYYHPNGQLAAEGRCAGEGADGLWKYWNETGDEEEPILWRAGYQVES